jgi:hypothetical protein
LEGKHNSSVLAYIAYKAVPTVNWRLPNHSALSSTDNEHKLDIPSLVHPPSSSFLYQLYHLMQLSLLRKFRAAEIIVMEVGLPVDYLLTRTSQADVEVEESTWYFRGGVAGAKV